jgi:ribonuclease III
MDTKFKSNPYNFSNTLLSQLDVLNILNNLNIQDYIIKDLSLFQQSFIHNSYCNNSIYNEYEKPKDCLSLFNKSYETLEFLGDSLLGSIITNYLYNRYVFYHDKNEGFLTKLKIRFVCGEQLSFLSRKLNLNKFMIISKHTEDCSGRENDHILEDIFESFIGALYLDSNKDYSLVEKFIVNCIETHIDIVDLILNDNNYKDQLLRYIQHNFSVHPQYKTVKEENNDQFVCNIMRETNNSEKISISKGYGSTKKKSEQDAAKNALIYYSVISK